MRVHELAKKYERTNKEMLDLIKTFGIEGKSHLSGLTEKELVVVIGKMEEYKNYQENLPVHEEENKSLFQDQFLNNYISSLREKYDFKNNEEFEVLSMACILDKPFQEIIDENLVIGKTDGGIDGIAFIENNGYMDMLVFQCKKEMNLKQNVLEKFINDFRIVFQEGKVKANTESLRPFIDEYRNLTNQGMYILPKLFFVYKGDNLHSNNKELFSKFNKEDFKIVDETFLKKNIQNLITLQSRREPITYNFEADSSNIIFEENQGLISFNIGNVNSLTFRMKAEKLCKLVDKEIEINGDKKTLFSENIREYLGNNETNIAIRETLLDKNKSQYFSFMNNGVTILCDSLTIPKASQLRQYIIPTENPVIVNGLQTTNVLYNVYKSDPSLLENVYVTIRLFATKSEEVINLITIATNTQTPINFSDKISNLSFNINSKEFFRLKNVAYITKKGEMYRIRSLFNYNDTISAERILKFWYATFFEKPEIAKSSKAKVISDIYEAAKTPNTVFRNVFYSDNPKIAEQFWSVYKILSIVEKLKNYNNKDFLRHSDELLSYGIYKEIIEKKRSFDEENIEDCYNLVVSRIEKIVDKEKSRLRKIKLTYSHNNYFKNSLCRFHYNQEAKIIELSDWDIISNISK